jgi:hypothetical protein
MNIPTHPDDSGPVVKLIHWTVSRLRYLEPGKRYCLHEILAMPSWNEEDPLFIEEARRFARLIIVNRLPFIIAGTHGRDQNLYRYTPWRPVDGICTPIQATEQEY